MVVRGTGSGTGFAPVGGLGCVGVAVIGPDEDYARHPPTARSPRATIATSLVTLNRHVAFMFDLKYITPLFGDSLRESNEFPVIGCL